MRIYWFLAAVAAVVLGGASIWMGGLNQDEGWYLYAANLVSEGMVPYRDFFFTQGPEMPDLYGSVAWIWRTWGLLGARVFTLILGLAGVGLAAGLARNLAPEERKNEAALVTFLLLGCNLYHLYYVTIPKTYALASLLVMSGFFTLSLSSVERKFASALAAGFFLAVAAGTRISLGAILPAVGLWLLLLGRWRRLVGFGVGGLLGLTLTYGPFLLDGAARDGLIAAQQYHTARGGFDLVWTVGSVSRLVRWYLPAFVVLGLGVAGMARPKSGSGIEQGRGVLPLILSFLAVFVVQLLAPFPYEDYQVPVMGLLAVCAAVAFVNIGSASQPGFGPSLRILLVLGLSFANSFGSPLLEKWMTNGQDRFWSLKKDRSELAQLRDVAQRINALDPDGKTLLTQDLYLAIETNRKVPAGLEMGPFSMLDDAGWRKLIAEAPKACKVAALSGYTFAIEPPVCNERPIKQQLEYWKLLKSFYEPAFREESFGQNATPLLVLKRK